MSLGRKERCQPTMSLPVEGRRLWEVVLNSESWFSKVGVYRTAEVTVSKIGSSTLGSTGWNTYLLSFPTKDLSLLLQVFPRSYCQRRRYSGTPDLCRKGKSRPMEKRLRKKLFKYKNMKGVSSEKCWFSRDYFIEFKTTTTI